MPKKVTAFTENGHDPVRSKAHEKHGTPRASQPGRETADAAVTDQSLQLLFSSNPHAMVVLDGNRRIQICNPAFENLFQHHQEEIRGTDLDSLLAPSELVGEARGLTERTAAGEVVRANTRRRRRDGSFVDVQITCVPLMANGRAVGSFAIYEDITERREAQRAQQQAEEKLSQLFENAVEGIFRATVDGQLLSVNPALARMCGYCSPAEMIPSVHDMSQDLYADPQARVEFQRRWPNMARWRASNTSFDARTARESGFRKTLALCAISDGEIVAYEGTMEDITERKRSELERQVTFEIIHA